MSKSKTIAILQSNYLPWKGYLDVIAAVDEFLIFDEAQFTRRDWRNRNKIIIDGRAHWLTIPVSSKGRFDAPIAEMETSEDGWAEKHWRSIRHAYGRAEYFAVYGPLLEGLYEKAAGLRRLSDINEMFLRALAETLQLTTAFGHTHDIPRLSTTPTARLVEICVGCGATAYLSGPAARSYIQNEEFEAASVALHYADYSGYPVYDQQSAAFEHGVSVVDTLMRCGPQTREHLKSVRQPGGLLARALSEPTSP